MGYRMLVEIDGGVVRVLDLLEGAHIDVRRHKTGDGLRAEEPEVPFENVAEFGSVVDASVEIEVRLEEAVKEDTAWGYGFGVKTSRVPRLKTGIKRRAGARPRGRDQRDLRALRDEAPEGLSV